MERVLILGPSGSGKSTLARRLGELTNLPVIHLDRLLWRPGWVETPKEEFDPAVMRHVGGQRWIMDGNYLRTLEARIAAADTIVFLDFPRHICLLRVVQRRLRYAGRSRPDMGVGCEEKIDREFLAWIWNFARDVRPRLVDAVKRCSGKRAVHVLTTRRAVEHFLRQQGSNRATRSP